MKINTLKQLAKLVDERKAVYCPKRRPWNKPQPAAWMIHLPGIQLLKCFESGMYLYQKEKNHERIKRNGNRTSQ